VRRNVVTNCHRCEQIRFRIGINLGDIVYEDGDIFGEGVNLAARVRALAEPGGIWITRNVYEQARYRLPLAFAAVGKHRVKNISEPVAATRLGTSAGFERKVSMSGVR
jgi:adenylate cyclase